MLENLTYLSSYLNSLKNKFLDMDIEEKTEDFYLGKLSMQKISQKDLIWKSVETPGFSGIHLYEYDRERKIMQSYIKK